ncbi:hypothetical protein QMO56_13860 [Roseomonas sp. E05]|uniref:hypothetical protein n=1 Tax=Roseomonas sp. E05 TaxID=3046310 RepID=UPI0024B90E8C|nr:hypothetical protein [Roseomonas sp. E05]MDJ0389202.1 hypothetical protein [Roseomonas sp. E05]
MPQTSSRPAPAPHRRLSAALADLHRTLLNAQAAGSPLASNPYALLQAVMHDPDFAWLRGFSNLMLRIDEAGAKGATPSAEAMQGFLADALHLVEGGGDGASAEIHARLQGFQLRPEVAAKTAALRVTVSDLRQALAQ